MTSRRSFLLVLSLAVVAASVAAVPAADAPPAPPVTDAARPAESDLTRVFRFHAAAQAEALRDAASSAEGLAEPLKGELLARVREYLERVEDEVADVAATAGRPPVRVKATPRNAATKAPAGGAPSRVGDVVERGAALARGFNEGDIARWLDDNPSAYQPVQEQIALAEAYQRAAADEPEAIARAARAAGLPAKGEAELRQALTDIQRKLRRWHDGAMRRVADAERAAAKAAGLPPPPEPREGTETRGAAEEGRGESDPEERGSREPERPDPFLEKLPQAEREKLELLSLLTEAEVHRHGVAAGRDARGAVERLLTEPKQCATLKDEMLRWYEGQAQPVEEPAGSKEGQAPAAAPRSE